MVLSNKKIEYDPPIEELPRDSDRQSVRNSVMGWIEDYMQICNLFKGQRMDLQQGDYLTEIRDSFEVRGMMSKITTNLDLIEEDCQKYIKNFEHFSDLWKYDPDEAFEKFLDDEEKKMDDFAKEMAKDDLSESEVVGDLGSLQEQSALLKGAKARIPPLELFDEIITELENKKREIQQMRDIMNIGWLRIIVSSLRDSLKIKVQKWIDVYTTFLLTQVKVILTNLQNFNKNTTEGIVTNPNDHPEDKTLLRKVMKIISDNEELTPQVEIFVDKIKGMVELLKQHQVPLEEHQIDIVLID